MPSVDHELPLRKAVAAALSAGEAGALVADVYGEGVPASPAFPFVSVGVIISSPLPSSCSDGIDASFAVTIEYRGESADDVYDIAGAVKRDLYKKRLALTPTGVVHDLQVATTQVTGSKPKWMAVINCTAQTSQ